MAFRKAKRIIKRTKKFVKKVNRHPVTKGIASIAKIAQMVKLLNVEKKRSDVTYTNQNFGQFNGVGVGGALCLPMTPVILEGVTGSTRNGLSLKLVSACIDIQFSQQSSALNNSLIRWHLICLKDNSSGPAASSVLSRYLEVNPFSNVIDFHSSRDPEFFSSMQVIKTGVVAFKADQLATGTYYAQKKIPLKLNHHLRYNTDATSIPTKNAFFLVLTQDQGDTFIATGATAQINARYYYVDN